MFNKFLNHDELGTFDSINYAAYKVKVAFEGGQLRYKNDVLGMWDIELLVG